VEAATASLQVRVRSVIYEAEDILRFELIDPQRHKLPAFSAGSHIDVHIAPGLVRQYSLCNDPAGAGSYHIAVLNEPAGRGGSKALHEQIRPGDLLTISEPRNFFPLTADAATHLLLAGGIGITPMMAMVAAACSSGWPVPSCWRRCRAADRPSLEVLSRRRIPRSACARSPRGSVFRSTSPRLRTTCPAYSSWKKAVASE
jgi:NAD(P)H-flavin reductase